MGIKVVRGRRIAAGDPDAARPCPDDEVTRRLKAERPTPLWASDFPCAPAWSGRVYGAFMIDAFAQGSVGWRVSTSMAAQVVLEQAIFQRKSRRNVTPEGDLLAGFDLVVELDQMLDEPALGYDDRNRSPADEDAHVLAGGPHRTGNDAVMRENIQRAPRTARSSACRGRARRRPPGRAPGRLRREARCARSWGSLLRHVEDLGDRIEIGHRPDLRHIQAGDVEGADFEAGRAGVEVDRGVGVRGQQPVEHQRGVTSAREAALVSGPFPVQVDKIDAPAQLGHLRCIARRAGRDMSATAITVPDISAGSSWFITVMTVCTEPSRRHARRWSGRRAGRASRPRRRSPTHANAARRDLHALEIQEALGAGLQIVNVERADEASGNFLISHA